MEAKNKKPDQKKNKDDDEKPKPYSNIKRMMLSLDRFLNKRIMGIGIFYLIAIIGCGAGLIINGIRSYASSGGEPTINNTDVWLFSAIGVITFLFILAVARVVAVRLHKNHEKAAENGKIANTK